MEMERIATAPKVPRNDKQITVVEYVHSADGGVRLVDELGPEERERFRQWLGTTLVRELYPGKAEIVYGSESG